MIYEVRAVLQNLLMSIPPARRVAEAFHSTGLNGNKQAAQERFDFLAAAAPVTGKDILELGPGQSPEVLECALRAGARRCVAVDTHLYEAAVRARGVGLEVYRYDGRHLPFADESFDVIWSSDVLEHVRFPNPLLKECARTLRPGGYFLAHVDLRDHYYLHDEPRWLECLKYPEPIWLAMTSNRSSFVNRLRISHWRQLFEQAGFAFEALDLRRSALLAEAYAAGKIRAWNPLGADDAQVVAFDCVCRKRIG